jgi:hypothetical protein
MTIIVSPSDISPLVNDRAAFVAVCELRELGHDAYVGERGIGSAGPNCLPVYDWDMALRAVDREIGKGAQ